jgi:hypothetical protein
MADPVASGGSNALLGVIIGAVLVLVVLFLAFGGWDMITGNDRTIDVDINVPAINAPAAQ